MYRIFQIVVVIAFSFTSTKASGNLEGVIGLLLDENRVVLFEERFADQSKWEFSSQSFGSDPDGGMDAGAVSTIREQKLIIGAYENCGDAAARAIRTIETSQDVDNIQWKVKLDHIYDEEGEGALRLNYGSVRIIINIGQLALPRIWDGIDNVTIVANYKDGSLEARANGKPIPSSVSIETNSDSSIEFFTSAGAADCGAGIRMVVSFIQASAVLEN